MLSQFRNAGTLRVLSQFGLSMIIGFAARARAQSPATADVAKIANTWLESRLAGPRLSCSIEPVRPFLDFAFRFGAGFVVRCPLRQFEGKEDTLLCLARITPAGGKPVLLGERFEVPRIPASMAGKTNTRKLKADLHYSGAFDVGEGRYQVSVLVLDHRNRFCRRSWKIKASLSASEKAMLLAVKPETAEPVVFDPWEIKPSPNGAGLRLTILLNAEPMRLNSPQLQTWDRLLLLESLSSLLKQTPCRSVRLIAFNLDQGKQIFEQDEFDESGFIKLAEALQSLNLSTVSYQALERRTWQHLLIRLMNQEWTATGRPDVIVVLGPRTRIAGRMPREMAEAPRDRAPRLFYFQFFPALRRGAEFPDAIAYLTKGRGGTVFKIHSPGELARAIHKFEEDINQNSSDERRVTSAKRAAD